MIFRRQADTKVLPKVYYRQCDIHHNDFPPLLNKFACVLPFSPNAVPAPGLHGGVVLPLVRSCHGGTSPGTVSRLDGHSAVG